MGEVIKFRSRKQLDIEIKLKLISVRPNEVKCIFEDLAGNLSYHIIFVDRIETDIHNRKLTKMFKNTKMFGPIESIFYLVDIQNEIHYFEESEP